MASLLQKVHVYNVSHLRIPHTHTHLHICIFLLDNGEGNHQIFFGDFLANVGHLGKVLR